MSYSQQPKAGSRIIDIITFELMHLQFHWLNWWWGKDYPSQGIKAEQGVRSEGVW